MKQQLHEKLISTMKMHEHEFKISYISGKIMTRFDTCGGTIKFFSDTSSESKKGQKA